MRQGSFIDKMVELGWTKASTFDNNSTPLVRCIFRYNAWLNIMSQFPERMLVPTLNLLQDIDLAWHTHQLKHEAYRSQTLNIIGRFVDHDDKVEESTLSDAYDQTAKYWEQTYGVPYHVCGCIHPPNKAATAPEPRSSQPRQRPVSSITSAISFHKSIPFVATMLSKLLKGRKKVAPRAMDDSAPTSTTALISAPVFTNTRPHIMSVRDSDASATHASEHNSVIVVGQPSTESRRDSRLQLHRIWGNQTRAVLDANKVPPDGWEAMSIRRTRGHKQAFTRPFPDPKLIPVVPFGAETCAAHNGGVLNGYGLPQQSTDGKFSAGVCATGIRSSDKFPLGEIKKYIEPPKSRTQGLLVAIFLPMEAAGSLPVVWEAGVGADVEEVAKLNESMTILHLTTIKNHLDIC
ncbi:ATP-dependent RNA helicase DOB1 [Ceratobasidium sp. AG-Ba]|nr:ATP-dependent RNA helicase DOB1 [Ceratobasidium sp. AG-Ba]